jgi:hypothetical protein
MPSNRRSASKAEPAAVDIPDTLVRPTWNTSVNTLPAFLPLLHKWLVYANPKYRTWVQYRYVASGRYTHGRSLNHIDRLIANTVEGAQLASKPTATLLEDARRVLFYLERTSTLGLTYEADQHAVHGYSDSDWGVKHSTTGWCFVYNWAVISWNSS